MKIVWFSEIKWSYLKTRKQQIISRFPVDWNILFIEPYVKQHKNDYNPVEINNLVHVTVPFIKATPSKILNVLLSNRTVYALLSFIYLLKIEKLLKKTGFQTADIVIVTSNIYYSGIIKKLRKILCVYDCNDYPLGFSNALEIAERCFAETLNQSDVIITVSKKLKHDIERFSNQTCQVIGNGVDCDLFSKSTPGNPNNDKQVIFFSGAIADWIDFCLIQQCIRDFSDAQIVFLGPVKDKEAGSQMELLKQNKNFIWIPPKEHHELPEYIRQADVCLLPFKKNRRTIGANPNTLYEYLACGKPVVTRDYSDEIEALSGLIYVAKDDGEFIAMIRRALTEKTDPEKLQAIARQNSWKSKSGQFVDLILRALEDKNRSQK